MFFAMLLFLIVNALLVPHTSADCPEGWWKSGEACYIVSQHQLSWYNAQEVLKNEDSVDKFFYYFEALLGSRRLSGRDK